MNVQNLVHNKDMTYINSNRYSFSSDADDHMKDSLTKDIIRTQFL